MNDFADVAEKILQNVNAVFEKDDLLDEFDILLQESQANRSPVIHQNHKLGLESWCTGHLYTHSFRTFIHLRPNKCVQTEGKFIEDPTDSFTYKNNNIDYSQLTEGEKWSRCLELTRLLVLLNPDLTVAWNFRRNAFKNKLCKLEEELRLVSLVASRKPKCPEGFYYRRWLIKETFKNEVINLAQTINLFQNEAKAALQAASKYFSNYHAWDYRIFLLDVWLSNNDVPGDVKDDILNSEKNVSDQWLNSHISDFCGYHYRHKLLKYFITFKLSLDESKQLLLDELKENREIIHFYPGHESLWYHRKNLIKQYLCQSKSTEDVLQLIEREKTLVVLKKPQAKNGDVYNNLMVPMNECIQLNHLYSERYFKWLQTCLE